MCLSFGNRQKKAQKIKRFFIKTNLPADDALLVIFFKLPPNVIAEASLHPDEVSLRQNKNNAGAAAVPFSMKRRVSSVDREHQSNSLGRPRRDRETILKTQINWGGKYN